MDNSSIEKLQLNSADLGDEVSLVISTIHRMSFYIALRNAPCVVQGARAIAEMLKRNSSLRVLELNNNMIEYSVCNFPKLIPRM